MPQPNIQKPLSPRIAIYRWRAPMLASITHRLSGLMLLAFVLFFLCLLQSIGGDQHDFDTLVAWMHSPWGKLFLWLSGASLMYHWCNGLRFLLLDGGVGDSRSAMRTSAKLSLGMGILALLLMGVWL